LEVQAGERGGGGVECNNPGWPLRQSACVTANAL